MFFESVKKLLDAGVSEFAKAKGVSAGSVHKKIGEHIAKMSAEHRKDEPAIPYEDPLCRLGYLYMHVAANASLVHWTINSSRETQALLRDRGGKRLRICAVGGGPGSELLGVGKFYVKNPRPDLWMPKKAEFVVLDRVPQWGESWTVLARETETRLEARAVEAALKFVPSVSPHFYPMDVCDPKSYENYAWLFADVDLFIFDYVLSENLTDKQRTRLQKALEFFSERCSDDAIFMFIDRKEYSDRINKWLDASLPAANFAKVGKMLTFDGALDGDEQVATDLGDYPTKLGKMPRVKFFTQLNSGSRTPTAFAIVAKKKT